MLIETAGALGRAFISVFGSETDETPLVRLYLAHRSTTMS
jgi:hypothetical protein